MLRVVTGMKIDDNKNGFRHAIEGARFKYDRTNKYVYK